MKIKKLFVAALAIVTVLTMSVVSSAEAVENKIDEKIEATDETENFVLIYEEQYVDEDGCTITDRLYVENGLSALASSGTKTLKKQKILAHPIKCG